MPDPQPHFARPPGGPTPPAPPGTAELHGAPDPSDPGPPIPVQLGSQVIGDLGHPNVDARLLRAIILRDGAVAMWLGSRGVDSRSIEDAFPGSGW